MDFSSESFSLEAHIGQEPLKFLDDNLTLMQIQQFLGIVNYVRDFVPHVAKLISLLAKMLKKNAPPWGSSQTKAVQ